MRTLVKSFFVLLSAAALAAGCEDSEESSTVVTDIPGASFPEPGSYQGGTTPQLDLDAPDPNWTYNDPHVLKVGSEYWMYASATVGFQFPVKLYRLVSSDGIDWHRDPLELDTSWTVRFRSISPLV